MTRNIYLAVEATGLNTNIDRIIEIVALEADDLKLTGRQFQVVLDPKHPMDPGAEVVTGYKDELLQGLPVFSEMASSLLKFVSNANLIVFNSSWALRLVDAELARLDLLPLSQYAHQLKDAQSIAKQLKLNVRLSTDRLSKLYSCREPAHICSQTWRDCYLLSQILPHLEHAITPA